LTLEELERAAAAHWQAPEQARLGEWLLRAAQGFTGRANSALPVGDPGLPLPGAVEAVTSWYRRRGLPPMIAVPLDLPADQTARGHRLDDFLAERSWVLRSSPAFVMTADIRDIPSPTPDIVIQLDPEPDPGWLALYRYRGQDLPPIARTLLLSAPWQAFASVRPPGPPAGRPPGPPAGQAVAVGRVSVAGSWGAISAVEVDAAWRRQGLAVAITCALAAAAARRGARRVLLQVEATNTSARALYERCGFRDAHRYHYRVAPTG
jgi:ribosomal protein S18 acetylase RimI-like enzyme